MALRYFFNEDEYSGPAVGLDDGSEHFWAGAMRCGAPLALAATFVAGAFSAPDEVAGLAPDEDYTVTVLNIPLWHSAWYAGTAAPVVPIASDDDTWQFGLTTPADSALYLVAPWAWGSSADDLTTVGTATAPADEDYWQNGMVPVLASSVWPSPAVFDQHELSPPAGQPEEEFWNSGVAAVQWSYAPLWPWALDPQDELSVPGTPDEDLWLYQLTFTAPGIFIFQAAGGFAGVTAAPGAPAAARWVNPFTVAPPLVQPFAVQSFPTIGPN